MKRFLILTLIIVSLLSCKNEQIGLFTTTSTEIRQEDLAEYVSYLASDDLGGREAGSSGIAKAEQYIANRFKSAGLDPVPGEDDYFLEFDAYRKGYDPDQTYLSIESGATQIQYRMHNGPDTPLVPLYFSGEGRLSLEFVFAGYGITAPEYEYDDYKDLNVEGKGVFVLRHEPQKGKYADLFAGEDYSDYALFTAKAENAAQHGAAAMILVDDPSYKKDVSYLLPPRSLVLDQNQDEGSLPQPENLVSSFLSLHIADKPGNQIAGLMKTSLIELETKLNSGVSPAQINLPPVKMQASVRRYDTAEEIVLRNVAGYVPAKNDGAPWLVFGAHHDHIGEFDGPGDSIFNGADDNASGVSAVMELAEYFGKHRSGLNMNLLFITFSAEEAGLLGARAVFEQHLLPEIEYNLMVNMDMIGRNPQRPVDIFLQGTAEDLQDFIREKASIPARFLYGNSVRGMMSDNVPFHEAGIPVVSFFTGTHSDYHGSGDHADKLDYERMEKITKLVSQIALYIVESGTN